MPPIVLATIGLNYKALKDVLNKTTEDYKIQFLGKKLNIYAEVGNAYSNLKEKMKRTKILYFTHTKREDKMMFKATPNLDTHKRT